MHADKNLLVVDNLLLDGIVHPGHFGGHKLTLPLQIQIGSINGYAGPVHHGEVLRGQTVEVGLVEGFVLLQQLEEEIERQDVELRVVDLLHVEHLFVFSEDVLQFGLQALVHRQDHFVRDTHYCCL